MGGEEHRSRGSASRPSIHARLIVPAAFRPEICQRARSVPSSGGSRAREDRLAILVMWRPSRALHGDTAPDSSTLPPSGAAPRSRAEGHAADHIRQEARNGLRMDPSECRRAGVFRNPVAAPPALPETRRSRSGPSVKSGSAEHRGGLRCGDKFRVIPALSSRPCRPRGKAGIHKRRSLQMNGGCCNPPPSSRTYGPRTAPSASSGATDRKRAAQAPKPGFTSH